MNKHIILDRTRDYLAAELGCSPELLPRVRELTEGRSRDELFELPLVYGQTIHFVPDEISSLPLPDGYEYSLLEGEGGLRASRTPWLLTGAGIPAPALCSSPRAAGR